MDEIKTLLEDPWVFSILSDVSQIVWGIMGWLNQAEIRGDHIAFWVFSGECNSPYTSASCYVQSVFAVVCVNWCQMVFYSLSELPFCASGSVTL